MMWSPEMQGLPGSPCSLQGHTQHDSQTPGHPPQSTSEHVVLAVEPRGDIYQVRLYLCTVSVIITFPRSGLPWSMFNVSALSFQFSE